MRSLRAVGEPISGKQSNQSPAEFYKYCRSHFYASGTAALAAAISAANQRHPVNSPEVILPAYGCPALVSAVLYNGATPVLVDLAADKVSLDINALQAHLTPNTVATVSVDLFGLPSLTEPHRQLLQQHGCTLIRDCAQATFPPTGRVTSGDEIVVISFGRGKPVSVLSGGAVLHSPGESFTLPMPSAISRNLREYLLTQLKFKLYNTIINPAIYGLVDYLPVSIGETRYSNLEDITSMSETAMTFLPANLARATTSSMVIRERYEKIFAAESQLEWLDLCQQEDPAKKHRLLRYAVLAPSKKARDQVLAQACTLNLGLTPLYSHPLPKIDGMPPVFSSYKESHHPNANRFADRLITLPLYSGLSLFDLNRIEKLIREPLINS